MKSLLTTIMLAATYFASHAQTPALSEGKAEIQFTEENHDFGTISEGTQATFEFKFKNTGNVNLVLSDVHASCGCTTPDWPRDPIAPGGTGIIKATYNSTGRPGGFNKSITVTSNASEKTKLLFIKGNVEPRAVSPDVAPPSPVVDVPAPAPAPTPTIVAPTPGNKPAAKPTTKPAAKPATKPAAKPATKPAAKPATKPTTKSAAPKVQAK